jgi:hypothetical protein
MSLVSKPTDPHSPPIRRLWKVSMSKGWWIWLVLSIMLYGATQLWFLQRMRGVSPGQPVGTGPMSIFGWISLALMVLATAYTLRRRYIRGLPGHAQNWLWMHLTIGTIAALVAMLHANYDHVLSNINLSMSSLLAGDAGPLAGYALYALVSSGLIGRLLDHWSARVMTREANTNGIGIPEAVEQHLEELEARIERLAAGKSADFSLYCQVAIGNIASLAKLQPSLAPTEMADFGQVGELLKERALLLASLHRQQRAKAFMRWWRKIHIVLAILTVLIVCLHVGSAVGPRLLQRLHLMR